MYDPIGWQDHVTEYEDRYDVSVNADGTQTHIPHPGEIVQQGTPQSATNFNHMECGIMDAHLAASLLTLKIHYGEEQNEQELCDAQTALRILTFGTLHKRRTDQDLFDLIASEALGEAHTVTLTNTQKFPFNSTVDRPVSVALDTRRRNLFYSVESEVTAHTGPVGEISITDKQQNGFKIRFGGSGSSVTLILRIKGGMSHG